MQFHEIKYGQQPPIDGYGPGFFRVGEELMHNNVLIMPSGVTAWAGYDDAPSIIAQKSEYDVIFIGTGNEIAPLPDAFSKQLDDASVPYDVMASPAAARTYNVLLSEGRRIAIALITVK